MNANVPAGAAILLDFIGETETGRKGNEAYLTIYGHNERKLPKPLTEYTLAELAEAQKAWSKNYGSSAAGKYQIIRKTLVGLIAQLGLPGTAKFSPDVQDRLGYALLKGRGYERFAKNEMSLRDFGNALAKEWASFPVLSDMQGASRVLSRGQSYYAGDGLNKALVKPGDVEAVLSDVANRASVQKPPVQPVPAPSKPADTQQPPPPASKPRKGLPWWLVPLAIAVLLAAVAFLVPLPL